jgi:hypothetical protein
MAKDAVISVRVTPSLKAALEKAAEADRRPLANLVALILADWVEEHAGKRR